MDNNSKIQGISLDELNDYIKQIKSYKAQAKEIAKSIKEEEELKKSRPLWKLVLWTGVAGIQHYLEDDSEVCDKIQK